MQLPDVWFVVIAVLWTGYFFLEGFDFGVGILTKLIGRSSKERGALISTIGPVWDGNEVWLITAAGATFAAFPDWYATMFSAFYLPTFMILVGLIVRGLALEYRAKRDDLRWKRNWDVILFWSSLVVPFLWGMLLANLVRGLPIGADGVYLGTLADLFNPYAVLGGLLTVVLFTFHGAVFAALKTDGAIRGRARDLAVKAGLITLALAAFFLVWTSVEFGAPASTPIAILGLAGLIAALEANRRAREGWAFVFSGVSVVAVTVTLFLALYPDVVPSTLTAQWSLTVDNAASGDYSLQIMTWIAGFATPLVLLYQGWTYWVFRQRIGAPPTPAPTPADRLPGQATTTEAGKEGRNHVSR
ncbi:cytochrome d ubiquinol oxidase subunit II [Saccharopolyspora mangrovi]|uniref:Cytochrome d ubiquinol oxidase subunit II n=1 Tax=Saccharopolyspora mangrovi TaxID=3082379 RepID=A0ABU6A4Z4_9PSEU|nr:cytochrome d ubiquinol oxidase subunit II [Saccharopolyspora sp. S2-29]MEB3366640.1 cytochrome d ubiquinol oxidase subunit II [Saccharopolyspora sp. S2-29]